MRTAFLTEMGFTGKIPNIYPNMRTELAWMHALDAQHYPLYDLMSLSKVNNFDRVFIIFPKGQLYLNAVGSRLTNSPNSISGLLQADLVSLLKSQNNKKIYYVQEGPHWLWNDYEIPDQVGFYNFVSSCDGIFAHNESDTFYYKGMFPHIEIDVIPTLMIESLLKNITPIAEEKVIIGGNFARWYGGFESYIVASEFNLPIWAQTSHAMREHETQMDNLNHFQRLSWIDWMKKLSEFKYAVHLMPTVAAGTFSLNCAYFGIPVIGNVLVDTQRICHPLLSVNVNDIKTARTLARRLQDDSGFYTECSITAREKYSLYNLDNFLRKMKI